MTRDEQREHEMERGWIIAGRAQRQSGLDRYVEGKKVRISYFVEPISRYRLAAISVGDVEIWCDKPEGDYPSEALMAKIALVVGATVGFDGIPEVRPTHHVSAEAKRYNREMAERTRGHWKA